MRSLSFFLSSIIFVNVKLEGSVITVETKYGPIRGTRYTVDYGIGRELTKTVDEFLGIPYAAPPTGSKRFKAPQPPDRWTKVRDGSKYGSVCPQESSFARTKPELQDEDCLYLNLYAPVEKDTPSKLYPVMVFIHGGSYVYGSGNRYNGTALAQHGVLVVALNYRLGALGFLSAGDDDMPGNLGLLDQIQALKWVQECIDSFRGDKNIVTVFGSSAGGASVGLLLLSPLAQGLFHRGIAQSGTANALWATHSKPKEELTKDFNILAKSFGCTGKTTAALVDCMKRQPWNKFLPSVYCKILECTEVDPTFKPAQDGNVMQYMPEEAMRQMRYPTVTYMTGTVRAEFGDHYSDAFSKIQLSDEVDRFVQNQYKNVPSASRAIKYAYSDWTSAHAPIYNISNPSSFYTNYNRAQVLSDIGLVAPTDQMAAYLASKPGMTVYLYHLDNNVSFHSVELNFVFGTPFIGGKVDEMNIITSFNSLDRRLSRLFMRMWTNFAIYGKPTVGDQLVSWNPVSVDTMDYLYITPDRESMRTHLRADKVALWNILLPDLLHTFEIYARNNNRDDPKTWVFFGLSVALFLIVILLAFLVVQGNRKGRKYIKLLRGNSANSASSANAINL